MEENNEEKSNSDPSRTEENAVDPSTLEENREPPDSNKSIFNLDELTASVPSDEKDRPIHWSEVDDDPTRPFPDPRHYTTEIEYMAAIKRHYNFDLGPPTPPEHLVMVGIPNSGENREKASPEIAEDGRGLFVEHLRMHFGRMNIDRGGLPRGGKVPTCRDAYFRAMMRFEKTPTRRSLMQQAHSLDIRSLTEFNYDQILEGLFFDSPDSSERVLLIFYFCADVIIRAIREHANFNLPDLYNWSVYYIETRLSTWVQELGGWEIIFPPERRPVPTLRHYATALGVLCIGIFALTILRRSRN